MNTLHFSVGKRFDINVLDITFIGEELNYGGKDESRIVSVSVKLETVWQTLSHY